LKRGKPKGPVLSLDDPRDPGELLEEGFQKVADVGEVPASRPLKVVLDGVEVLLCRHKFNFFAVASRCPHRDTSMAEGTVDHGRIVCPFHGFSFDLVTGECDEKCDGIGTFEVKVCRGGVYLKV